MYSEKLRSKISDYYTTYYKDDCCLPDYKARVIRRLDEESVELKRINELQQLTGYNFFDKKHFIFGAGTGGLAIVLKNNFKCGVFGIEPDEREFEIIQGKCHEAGIDSGNFKQEFGEQTSFNDDEFDFVHCFTVLEHVADVERCIDEMIRITKPGGKIFIYTPNYAYPYEGHYKILFPTFLPKPLQYLYLIIKRKSYKFLKTINFVTEKGLNRILIRKKGIVWFRLYVPEEKRKGIIRYFLNLLLFKCFVYKDQNIIIQKDTNG